jgi:hypothetical protein
MGQMGHMLTEMRSSSPVRTLRRAAILAGREIDVGGRRLNRLVRRQPQLVPLAALALGQVIGPLLARRRPAAPRSTFATRAGALGALAVGALALGVVSIGALAIARLSVRSMKIKRLQIGVLEVQQTIGTPLTAAPATPA